MLLGVLVLVLVLGDVRMEQAEEGDGEVEIAPEDEADSRHQSYNRTLAMLTQARQDVQNVTKGIEDMIEGIDRTVERQNQVPHTPCNHELTPAVTRRCPAGCPG